VKIMRITMLLFVAAALGRAQGPTYPYSVNLSWTAESGISSYNCYQAPYTTACGSYTKINTSAISSANYTVANPAQGAYCFAVTAVGTCNGNPCESGLSVPQTNIVIPPPPPTGLTGVLAQNGKENVDWKFAQSVGSGIKFNTAYCNTTGKSPFKDRAQSPNPVPQFWLEMDKGKHYCGVTATDGNGRESGLSNVAEVTVE
jgi:hypothetical protein